MNIKKGARRLAMGLREARKTSAGAHLTRTAGRQSARPAHGRERRNLIEKNLKLEHFRLIQRKRKEPASVCQDRGVRAGVMRNSAGGRARLRSETVL